ncbi:MAG: hypothetical protein ABIF01_03955 [Candidatus Micrarchaeota archaeon]
MGNGNGFGEVLTSSVHEVTARTEDTSQRRDPGTIRLAYITSPRELEKEGAGSSPLITPTLEYLQRAILAGNKYISRIEIAAVVVDDSGRASQDAEPSRAFTFLKNLCEQNGITLHVEESAPWRSIRGDPVTKANAKLAYEERILDFMRTNKIDIILSDSYTILFDRVMLDQQNGYRGLLLNVHPGVNKEVPGLYPTRDALSRANMFAHDQTERDGVRAQLEDPTKQMLELRRNGNVPSLVNIFTEMKLPYTIGEDTVTIPRAPNIFRATTGACLHLVNEILDGGRPILGSTGTPIREGTTEQELRIDNYTTKNNVVLRGLGMFIRERETQNLILENRVRNANFSQSMPVPVALAPRSAVPIQNNRLKA